MAVCLAQCSSRQKYDVNITFAGAKILNNTEQEGLCSALEAVMPADFDGNGAKAVQLVTYGIFAEEELLQLYSSVNSEGVRVVDQFAYGNARKQSVDEGTSFSTYVKTGECAVWFVSPYVYETYNLSLLAAPLADVFGSQPESAADEFTVRLGDTAFYRYYSVVRVLPEDTLILLTQPYIYGKTHNENTYADFREMFKAIVEFRAP